VVCLIALSTTASGAPAPISAPGSSFTATDGRGCRLLSEDEETGDRTTRCPGVGGFSVLILESDDRASITLINPAGRELPLDFWGVAVPSFSTLGSQIEWRRITSRGKQVPIGMIVQLDTVDQTDAANPKPISFFLAAKITENSACVTAKIPLQEPGAYALARTSADDPNRGCFPQLNH
jgi:hypothetical protein